jgi:tetratricopeptide (TPR) repeat protein
MKPYNIHKLLLLTVLGGLAFIHALSQQNLRKKADSILALPMEDTGKIDLLLRASQKVNLVDSVESVQLALNATDLAEQVQNKRWMASCYYQLGSIYFVHGDYKKGAALYDKTVDLIKDAYPDILIRVYKGYAWAYNKQGLFAQSVTYYQKALSAAQQSGNKNSETGILNSMGELFFFNKQYPDAVRYHQTALTIANEAANKLGMLSPLDGLVKDYLEMYKKIEQRPIYIDSALFYADREYELLQTRLDLKGNMQFEPFLYQNQAELFYLKNDFPTAIGKAMLSIQKARLLADTSIIFCKSYLLLSKILYRQNKYVDAEQYRQLALGILAHSEDQVLLNESYEEMISMMRKKKDTMQAFLLQSKLLAIRENLFTLEKAKAINRLQIQYETAQKEFTIKELKRTNVFILICSLAGLGISVLLARSYRLRKKLLLQRQQLLEEENQKINLEKLVQEEFNQKLLLSQQLEKEESLRRQEAYENSMKLNKLKQEQLQHDIDFKYRELTSQMVQLENKNDILLQIKSDIQKVSEKNNDAKEGTIRTILKLIDQNLTPDEDFDNFRKHFENVHPDFFTKLIDKSGGQLSQLDLKHCAYIKMNFGTKEIANMMNVEPKSIRMTRYRLKQKFNLERELDLANFINAL